MSIQGVLCAGDIHVWFSNAKRGEPCKCGKMKWQPGDDGTKRVKDLETRVAELERRAAEQK